MASRLGLEEQVERAGWGPKRMENAGRTPVVSGGGRGPPSTKGMIEAPVLQKDARVETRAAGWTKPRSLILKPPSRIGKDT